MSDPTSDNTEFPPPTQGENPITWNEMVASQIKIVQTLNQYSYYLTNMVSRIQYLEDLISKFLGIDEQGRIPGMPGYDGPLKDAVKEYEEMKAQTKPTTSEPPVTPGAYL